MTNAVIYARYSSESQTEQSIEGQIADCLAFAERNDYKIIGQYIDRAKTGLKDNRADFQRLMRDSASGAFSVVLVWKFDRFSRNMYQSAIYEHQLEQNNVRLVSAMEPVAEGAMGTITKGMLRVLAQYYSEDLREKVTRGMRVTAEKGKVNGGARPLGYKFSENGEYEIIPEEAAVVRFVFESYAEGVPLSAIAASLNEKGHRTTRGRAFNVGSFTTMLRNRRYTGVYIYDDVEIEGRIPAIISKELFERVQSRFAENAGKGGRGKAKVDYLLTGRIYCGKCGHLMGGESTVRRGERYSYYACSQKKKHRTCDKKNVPKDAVEDAVVLAVKDLLTDEYISKIVSAAAKQAREDTESVDVLNGMKAQLKETEKKVENMVSAIASGVNSASLRSELEKQEQIAEQLRGTVSAMQIMIDTIFDIDAATAFMHKFKGGDVNSPSFRKDVCSVFVNRVVVYDDHFDVYFNYRENDDPSPLVINVSDSPTNDSPSIPNSNIFIFSDAFMVRIWR